jgi:uncharacterized protein YciW
MSGNNKSPPNAYISEEAKMNELYMEVRNALTNLRSGYVGDGLYDAACTTEQYWQLSKEDRVAFRDRVTQLVARTEYMMEWSKILTEKWKGYEDEHGVNRSQQVCKKSTNLPSEQLMDI